MAALQSNMVNSKLLKVLLQIIRLEKVFIELHQTYREATVVKIFSDFHEIVRINAFLYTNR
jgi:hypothetical protein